MLRTAHRPTTAGPDWARLAAATADLDPPFAVVDLPALLANAADMRRRAGGRPIRVASKSVRAREVLRRVLALDGYAGVLAYSLAEALWLAEGLPGTDIVVGYPTADRAALRALAASEELASRVTLMVDSVDQLDFVDAALRGGDGGGLGPGRRPPLRVCLDLDASLRLAGGRVHLGVRRSPVHTVAEATALARAVGARPGFRLVGLMAYEAQIAGLGDAPASRLRAAALRRIQARSRAELAERRAAVVAAVRSLAPLEFVNGGGTGSLHTTSAEPAVTELAAGSGLYGPTLFDSYRAFTPAPAALFALAVVRRPAPGFVTVAGGGWIASGPPGPDRSPRPVHPAGLRLIDTEGAGEVQTPLRGRAADRLRPGDRVWFRHAKAGELCEHVNELYLVEADGSVEAVPTYRGEGRAF